MRLFQSTRPRGARRYWADDVIVEPYVSIHAPAGGATQQYGNLLYYYYSFNPRARGGRDDKRAPGQGGKSCFNPRARGGRD